MAQASPFLISAYPANWSNGPGVTHEVAATEAHIGRQTEGATLLPPPFPVRVYWHSVLALPLATNNSIPPRSESQISARDCRDLHLLGATASPSPVSCFMRHLLGPQERTQRAEKEATNEFTQSTSSSQPSKETGKKRRNREAGG